MEVGAGVGVGVGAGTSVGVEVGGGTWVGVAAGVRIGAAMVAGGRVAVGVGVGVGSVPPPQEAIANARASRAIDASRYLGLGLRAPPAFPIGLNLKLLSGFSAGNTLFRI